MLKRSVHRLIVVALCLAAFSAAYAQEGRGGHSASGNGGRYGSPGMAGATGNGQLNLGGAEVGAGERPDVGGAAGAGERPGGGATNRPGGGERPIGGERPGRGSGAWGFAGRPSSPSGRFDQSSLSEWFGGAEGIQSRLNRAREEGMSWAEFGGFGKGATSGEAPPEGATGELGGRWNPSDELPTAPGAMESIEEAVRAQASAIAEATAEAQEAARAAYDQFWADYYAAVGYAASAYYEAVAGSAEEVYALYMDALAQTTAAVDYYLDYAAQFAAYCYYYPWDCYSYAYNAATGEYENVESNSDQPVGEVTVGDVTVTVTWPEALGAPAGSAQAYEALVVFANDQLGAVVQPLYAGVLTEDILLLVQQYLPDDLEAYLALLTGAQAYWGIVSGGVGAVAVGNCTAEAPCALDDIPAALSTLSAGAFALAVAQPAPSDAAGALDLITTVYPALNGLEFSQIADVETGLAFMATAYGVGVDESNQPVTAAKLIYAGVLQAEGQTVVYAMVAVGQAQVEAFHSLFAGGAS